MHILPKKKRLVLTWLIDLEWRNIQASGLLDELSSRFEEIVILGSTFGTQADPKTLPANVVSRKSRWLFADPTLSWLAAICTIYYVCRDTKFPERIHASYRKNQQRNFFLARNFFWLFRPIFLVLLVFRTLLVLPALMRLRPSLLVTQSFVWSAYDSIVGLYARWAGIPWMSIVTSWDNTTNKGEFHLKPQKILVWGNQNIIDGQAFLRMPESAIVALPPPHFTRLRAIKEETPTKKAKHILYLGTTNPNFPQQTEFVHALAKLVRKMGITDRYPLVVRPHPNDSAAWAKEFSGVAGVVLDEDTQNRQSQWSVYSTDRDALDKYYRLLRDSLAVINVYSTATVEAALLGTLSIVPRIFFPPEQEFKSLHDGQYHTRELRKSPGLLAAKSMEELEQQLRKLVNEGVDPALVEAHLRHCEVISKYPPADLLRQYGDVITGFARD